MAHGESITSKQPSVRDDALAIIRRLRDAGYVAYLAGGCVRDMLLGIDAKDFDVATDAPPDRVRTLFINTQAVGAKFGVILVRQGKSVIEVATFRTDIDYEDGRHPRAVKFTTAQEDAQRRDFTINGLFFDPIANVVIDHVGGQADLKAKILRAIGEPNHRFEEDHLRLLRAVRFAARFDLKIEPMTEAAIRAHARYLTRISPERIAEELRLMLTPSGRRHAYELLRVFGLLDVILRFLPARATSVGIFDHLDEPRITFSHALAAITLDVHEGRPLTPNEIRKAASAFRQPLKISNDEMDAFEGALSFTHLLQDDPPSVAQMKRFLAEPTAAPAMKLMAAIAAVGINPERIRDRLKQLKVLQQSDYSPRPLITGDDLVARGLQPGKLFKRILDEVYDAQLEDRISTKDQAMDLAMRIAKAGQQSPQ